MGEGFWTLIGRIALRYWRWQAADGDLRPAAGWLLALLIFVSTAATSMCNVGR